jgi:hypothetical protein
MLVGMNASQDSLHTSQARFWPRFGLFANTLGLVPDALAAVS